MGQIAAGAAVVSKLHGFWHDRTLLIYSSFSCVSRQSGRFLPLRADLTEPRGDRNVRRPVRDVLVGHSCRQAATRRGDPAACVASGQSVGFVVDGCFQLNRDSASPLRDQRAQPRRACLASLADQRRRAGRRRWFSRADLSGKERGAEAAVAPGREGIASRGESPAGSCRRRVQLQIPWPHSRPAGASRSGPVLAILIWSVY